MSFVPLVEAWESSREERTGMRHGERVASIESEIEGSMRPGGVLAWLLGRDEPEQDIDDEERER